LCCRPDRGQRDGVQDYRKVSDATAASTASAHPNTDTKTLAHARPWSDGQAATAAVASAAAACRQVRDQEATGETVG